MSVIDPIACLSPLHTEYGVPRMRSTTLPASRPVQSWWFKSPALHDEEE